RRFHLVEITLLAPDGRPLAEHINGIAYRRDDQHDTSPWIMNFNAKISQGLIAGARFSGNLQFGSAVMKQPLAQGRVSFWEVPLRHIKLADVGISARLDGDVELAVSADNQTTGHFTLATHDLIAEGSAVRTALTLGSFWSRGDYRLSPGRGDL